MHRHERAYAYAICEMHAFAEICIVYIAKKTGPLRSHFVTTGGIYGDKLHIALFQTMHDEWSLVKFENCEDSFQK